MSHTIQEICLGNQNYPKLLKEIYHPPKKLYFRGVFPAPDECMVAIVGTRKATHDGLLIAKNIARDLAARGVTIISGLALGIDGAAHEGALAARLSDGNQGKTIAVLANGLESVYPRAHEHLAEKILAQNGALISEYPEDTPAYPNQFLERNRIVSGMSAATVVIEAPIRSGSLVTARLALQEGREVFVVPGPAASENYKGSHLLLRYGARLATDASDILEDLNMANTDIPSSSPALHEERLKEKIARISDTNQIAVMDALRAAKKPLSVDNIVEITKLEPYIVNQALTFLVFDGVIKEKNGKFIIKAS